MKKIKFTMISLSAVGVLSFFQNCSPVSFEEAALKSESLGVTETRDPNNPSIRNLSQNVHVSANSKVDILFVVDNSRSMREEQVGLANKISGFMNIIKDLDWQIALTTTDPRGENVVSDEDGNNQRWGDGQFRAFDGGSEYVLKKGINGLSEAQSKLATAIQVGIWGSGDERGINAVYRGIERAFNGSYFTQANKDFFRANSNLVVVVISDEDECSSGRCGNLESQPDQLVSLVADRFGPEKVFKFNSIIRASNDHSCDTASHTANTYEHLSHMTGGIIGSICANDYTSILNNLGNSVVELVRSANLACDPIDANGDGNVDVALHLSTGGTITTGFNIRGSTVTFSSALPEGDHTITYSCYAAN